ncbi:MAG TPA: TraR/DksA family transcriptional regulator [Burkholderiales bacterium]|nr:TraR/DksA family transcriptional regulator [Burkholderiales bacterium]
MQAERHDSITVEIAMPLTDKQSKELSGLIDQRRDALIAELREDAARVRDQPYSEHAGPAPDTGDESVASLFADLEQADVGRDLYEFRALEAARDRLKGGEYGICADCGGDIAFERLKATPSAARCIDCQTRHEKTYGGDPKPSL